MKLVSVELTQACTNACGHCYNFWRDAAAGDDRPASPSELSRSEIRRLLRKVRTDIDLTYVALSGGEPLLRPDFAEIVTDLVEMDIHPVIITNGVLLTRRLLERLPQGLHFEVTLFGHTAELHDRLAGARVYERILRNLRLVEKHGSGLTVVFVAMRPNALEVLHVARLAKEYGATSLMYNRLNLSRGTRSRVSELVPPADLLGKSLGLAQQAVRQVGLPVVCSVPVPPCVLDIARYPDLHFGWCPRGGDNAYYTIGTNGFLRPCNHSSRELGDLREKGFNELISGRGIKAFWRSLPEECADCQHELRDQCAGGCRAAAEEFGGRPGIDPYCELATG